MLIANIEAIIPVIGIISHLRIKFEDNSNKATKKLERGRVK